MEIHRLDPKKIFPTTWATREVQCDVAFENLKADIGSNGGNIAPIKVRPTFGIAGEFQIVFGHRRHQACLELQLDVLAIVEAMDDMQLVKEMDKENRFRIDASPYEQGALLKKTLDHGLFPSARKMFWAMGIDQKTASKALIIARLPKQILEAFQKPSCIKENWARKIDEEFRRDPDMLLHLAKQLANGNKKLTANQVYQDLTKYSAGRT